MQARGEVFRPVPPRIVWKENDGAALNHNTQEMHTPRKTVGLSLLAAAIAGVPLSLVPAAAHAEVSVVQQAEGTLKGTVKDNNGEPAIGATVLVVGTKNITTTDLNGAFTLKNVPAGATVRVSLIGYARQDIKWKGGPLNVVLEDAGNNLNEVVVTAMGILRKEKSLTYATQQIKSDELNKVQDVNVVNGLEGKVSGITITQGAGGAGGASKIQLRGAQSILGDNQPLIVVDGVPMTNSIRSQADGNIDYTSVTEGSDALSMINPDDIESMNVLKGANAAALYGSRAANGVIMITTKKGKEGRVDVTFTSNITFDTPLTTPKLQNIYGASVNGTQFSPDSWGGKLSDRSDDNLIVNVARGNNFYGDATYNEENPTTRQVHLRNKASDDISDFFRTGVTTNNSIALSGGTDKVKSYFSYANAHSNGMLENNSYNRNTLAFRQSYNLFKRVHIEASINYMQTKTRNRVGGGTVGNPIYDLYTMPRNVDLSYYKENYSTNGYWQTTNPYGYYTLDKTTGKYTYVQDEKAKLSGLSQEWAFQSAGHNNPYWLMNQNYGIEKESRVYGYISGKIDIYDGLAFQARVSYDHNKYEDTGARYATTQGPNDKFDYGTYWFNRNKSNEIYADYLLSYNKSINDFSVSATAGWVGHSTNSSNYGTYTGTATHLSYRNGALMEQPSLINYFEVSDGGIGTTSYSKSFNWDKAALVTAQLGWRDAVYVDGSYRRDWYRAFRQFKHRGTPDNYGYFSFGASAIISQLAKLPAWFNYLKYRLSYSEVGNSIPNTLYSTSSSNYTTGAATVSSFLIKNPRPEITRSFETGFEAQFLDNRLAVDFTFYNSGMHRSYITRGITGGYTEAINSAKVRNRGLETTVSYNFSFGGDWRWKTSLNYSFNKNKILATARDANGNETPLTVSVAGGAVQVIYKEGGSYGDMYVNDFDRYTEDGVDESGNAVKAGWIKLDEQGVPLMKTEKQYSTFGGNMYARHQLGWSNTISWKNLSLFFLINGKIGGKVISLTEAYLDRLGLSERVGKARQAAEAAGFYTAAGKEAMYLPDGSGRTIGIQDYYERTAAVGSNLYAKQYTYNATNFRLRELSLGYTFRDLFGENTNLTLSFIGRNLFFIYKDAPVDPDVALSTGNGLSAFEMFNLPSSRSYGFSLKLNF